MGGRTTVTRAFSLYASNFLKPTALFLARRSAYSRQKRRNGSKMPSLFFAPGTDIHIRRDHGGDPCDRNAYDGINPHGQAATFAAVPFVFQVAGRSVSALLHFFILGRKGHIRRNGDSFSGFTINEAGVTVSCTVEYEGYELRPDTWSQSRVLVPAYGGKPSFSINFSVTKA